jgi:hypothetical protein
MSLFTNTFLNLVAERSSEIAASSGPCVSLEQAIGRFEIDLHRVRGELALPVRDQNSENLLEALVSLAITCTRCAEDVVLPQLEEETD